MTSNEEKIFDVVAHIPKGCVATYGDVARIAGVRSPRYVGHVLHHNPDPTRYPCHRVVRGDGKLAHAYAFGGLHAQEKRLRSEGVLCKKGRVITSEKAWRNA